MLNKLIQGDCLELMKKLPDNSVDMVCCDLPFSVTDAAWDRKIDLQKFWTQARRILKPCCSAVMFASSKFSYELYNSNREMYKYKWIWIKNYATCFQHAKNQPMHKFEEILVFSDSVVNHATLTDKRMKYFPQGVKKYFPQGVKNCSEPKQKLRKQNSEGVYNHGIFKPHYITQENFPSDVLFYKKCGKNHPTEKPTDLLEYLIKTYSNEGETVLDATIGSGSTAVAAINTGRNFIGFELDKKYFEIACDRVQKAFLDKSQPNLF